MRQTGCIVIGTRGVLIEGPPGAGKSSLALALIDRGATLVGDDGVVLENRDGQLIAMPHPNTQGLMEVRNLGLLKLPTAVEAVISLLLVLDEAAPRYIEAASITYIAGVGIPTIHLWPGSPIQHIKAELALQRFGLN